eukprot:TRINITY_DN22026_c0_g1_i1.p1 TRINITY_DN22026_c0_g1~~TRINITY_DN22026_c0_g1_i1.p1  ORF type:complete len:251 (+),score=79.66 TRINITY_DN22026_c0_g1_i1:60-812(+)
MGCEGSKVDYTRPAPQPVPAKPAPQPASRERAISFGSTDTVASVPAGQAAGFKHIPGVPGQLQLHAFPSKKAVKALKAQGCDVLVTLQKDEEGAQKVRALCEQAGMRWVQVDFWKLYHGRDVDAMHAAVCAVADDLRDGQKVVLHCAAGIHRTGMMAYAVLRALDMPPHAAIESLHALRETTHRRVGAHRVYGIEDFLAQALPAYHTPLTPADFPPATDKPLPPLVDLSVRCETAADASSDACTSEASSV